MKKERKEKRKKERKEDMKKVRKEADQEKEGKANTGDREHKTQT